MKNGIDQQLKAAIESLIRGGVTRYAVAKGADIDYHSLVRWLDEEKDIRLATAAALAKFAGLQLTKK